MLDKNLCLKRNYYIFDSLMIYLFLQIHLWCHAKDNIKIVCGIICRLVWKIIDDKLQSLDFESS